MALIIPIQKLVSESPSTFNTRLADACQQEDSEGEPVVITDATLIVADGVPMVVLTSEMVEASEEDAAELKDDDVNEGDLIPAGPGVIAQVMKLGAKSDAECATVQERLNSMATRLGGDVLRVTSATGKTLTLVDIREKDAAGKEVLRQVPVQEEVTYVLMMYSADTDDTESKSKDD